MEALFFNVSLDCRDSYSGVQHVLIAYVYMVWLRRRRTDSLRELSGGTETRS
jgi:hypothetical protein